MAAEHEDLDIKVLTPEDLENASVEDASSEATSQPTSTTKEQSADSGETPPARVITGPWDKEEGEPTPYITDTLTLPAFTPPGSSTGQVDKLLERHRLERSTREH